MGQNDIAKRWVFAVYLRFYIFAPFYFRSKTTFEKLPIFVFKGFVITIVFEPFIYFYFRIRQWTLGGKDFIGKIFAHDFRGWYSRFYRGTRSKKNSEMRPFILIIVIIW